MRLPLAMIGLVGLVGCGTLPALDPGPFLVRTLPAEACPGDTLYFTARMPDRPVRVALEGNGRGATLEALLGADGTLAGTVDLPARWAGPVYLRFETAGGNVYRHRVTCPSL